MDGATIVSAATAVGVAIGAATAIIKSRTEHEASTVDGQVRIMAELNEKLNEDNERLREEVKELRAEVRTLRTDLADQTTLIADMRREIDQLNGKR